jgi:predicted phosphodiesterase
MKVFVIGDLHFPYASKKHVHQVLAAIKKERPTHVVQVGDLLDQYVFSKYPRSLSITPKEDAELGVEMAKEFWKQVKKRAPRAKCFQLLGNHDLRLAKRIMDKLPELEGIYRPLDMYQFSGVTTLKSDREYLKLDGVIYVHGWYSASFRHAEHFNLPTVHGHLHKPGITTRGQLWSMDVGYLADPGALPLQYGNSTVSPWRHAYGIVENGKPRLELL